MSGSRGPTWWEPDDVNGRVNGQGGLHSQTHPARPAGATHRHHDAPNGYMPRHHSEAPDGPGQRAAGDPGGYGPPRTSTYDHPGEQRGRADGWVYGAGESRSGPSTQAWESGRPFHVPHDDRSSMHSASEWMGREAPRWSGPSDHYPASPGAYPPSPGDRSPNGSRHDWGGTPAPPSDLYDPAVRVNGQPTSQQNGRPSSWRGESGGGGTSWAPTDDPGLEDSVLFQSYLAQAEEMLRSGRPAFQAEDGPRRSSPFDRREVVEPSARFGTYTHDVPYAASGMPALPAGPTARHPDRVGRFDDAEPWYMRTTVPPWEESREQRSVIRDPETGMPALQAPPTRERREVHREPGPETARWDGPQQEDRRPAETITRGSRHEPERVATPSRSVGKTAFTLVKEAAIVLTLALVLSLVTKTWLVQTFYIPSESMEATLKENDRVVVSKLTPGVFGVQRGDVVVFQDPARWLAGAQKQSSGGPVDRRIARVLTWVGLMPSDDDNHLIKRVIGLPGDRVVCCGPEGLINVNGVPLREFYLNPAEEPQRLQFDIVVPKDSVWVMGDNRNHSGDSRLNDTREKASGVMGADALDHKGAYGSVPVDKIVGRAFAIVYPFSRMTWMGDQTDVFSRVPSPPPPQTTKPAVTPAGKP